MFNEEYRYLKPPTWRRLYEVYWNIRDNVNLPPGDGATVPPLPPPGPGPGPGGIPPYPGVLIRVGSRGPDVERVQRCLNTLSDRFPSIGRLNVDGIFGPLTQNAVINYQRANGLVPEDAVIIRPSLQTQ